MLYAHNDKSHWGEQFAMACGRNDEEFKLFRRAAEVPEGAKAFVRLSQQAEQRVQSKQLISDLAARGVKTLPSLLDAQLYDDKIRQLPYLEWAMPKTFYTESKPQAEAKLREMTFPFVSKASIGSGSANVRLIENRQQGEDEIARVFGCGIELSYGNKQVDYIYWQEFLPGNTHDTRVIVCGEYIFGIRRHNRKNVPFASGSGSWDVIEHFEDYRDRQCADLALSLADQIGTGWAAFDFVFDGDKARVLEVSAAWTTHVYANCPVYDATGSTFIKTPFTGGHMFDIAVEILVNETFL